MDGNILFERGTRSTGNKHCLQNYLLFTARGREKEDADDEAQKYVQTNPRAVDVFI